MARSLELLALLLLLLTAAGVHGCSMAPHREER
jgi:hypothetical protein